MLHKLSAYGITGSLLNWICDFLTARIQRTRVGTSLSNIALTISGVVQGSCLGPILFLIYINDVVDLFSSSGFCKLYADDVKIYTDICHNEDAAKCLQINLDKLFDWSALWQLPLSYDKCTVIVFSDGHSNKQFRTHTLNNTPMHFVTEIVDLGVTIDTNMKFVNHFTNIIRKASTKANLIIRGFISKNAVSLVRAFKIYVRPILEYCSPIWNPHLIKDITRIESVQRHFTKRLIGMRNKTYEQRLIALGLESLEIRRLRIDLLTIYKIIFGHLRVNINEFFVIRGKTSLRGHDYKISLPLCHKSIRLNFLSYRVLFAWNNLPLTTNFSSINGFKHSLLSTYLVHYCKVNFH